MMQDQPIKEIKPIPEDKLAETYDLSHYFRLGLKQESVEASLKPGRPIGLAKGSLQVPASFFESLPVLLDTCTFLGITSDAPELSDVTRRLCRNLDHKIFLSVVSVGGVPDKVHDHSM